MSLWSEPVSLDPAVGSCGPLAGSKLAAWAHAPLKQGHDSHCETYLLPSYWGTSCAGPQASTAATDHYCTTYDTSTTDSAVSEQDALACTELLLASESAFATDQPVATKSGSKGLFAPLSSFNTPAQHEVRETIRNEMARERETQPQFYFKRHAFLSKELRGIAVSWAIQVVDQFRVEQETLFLAISYLDRFLSITEDVVHMDGLHLATLACLSLAAKQAEVTQPSTAEWTWLVHANSWGNVSAACIVMPAPGPVQDLTGVVMHSGSMGPGGCDQRHQKEQLSRMEWIVMDNLEWRGCTPTAWWFLHLFCYGLGTCPAPAICMAAYLLELGLLEAGCLAYSYSSLAAAALMLGHTAVDMNLPSDSLHDVMVAQPMMQMDSADGVMGLPGVPMLAIQSLVELAPELNLHQVQDACAVLAELHTCACALPAPLPDQALEGLQLARAKYSTEVWHHVGARLVPVNLKAALDRF